MFLQITEIILAKCTIDQAMKEVQMEQLKLNHSLNTFCNKIVIYFKTDYL
jgi:hypothetical protein